jgi:hypothetical protein
MNAEPPPDHYTRLMRKRGAEIVDQLAHDYREALTIGMVQAEVPYLKELADREARAAGVETSHSDEMRTALARYALILRAREIADELVGDPGDRGQI